MGVFVAIPVHAVWSTWSRVARAEDSHSEMVLVCVCARARACECSGDFGVQSEQQALKLQPALASPPKVCYVWHSPSHNVGTWGLPLDPVPERTLMAEHFFRSQELQ